MQKCEILLSTSESLNTSSIVQTCYIRMFVLLVKEPSTFSVTLYFKPKLRPFLRGSAVRGTQLTEWKLLPRHALLNNKRGWIIGEVMLQVVFLVQSKKLLQFLLLFSLASCCSSALTLRGANPSTDFQRL